MRKVVLSVLVLLPLTLVFGSLDQGSSIGVKWNGILMALAAACLYAVTINLISYKLSGVDSFVITSGQTILAMIMILPLVPEVELLDHTTSVYVVLLGLGIIGTVLPSYVFNTLIKSSGIHLASSTTFLIPIMTTILLIAAGKQAQLHEIIGICGVCVIIFLIRD